MLLPYSLSQAPVSRYVDFFLYISCLENIVASCAIKKRPQNGQKHLKGLRNSTLRETISVLLGWKVDENDCLHKMIWAAFRQIQITDRYSLLPGDIVEPFFVQFLEREERNYDESP